MDAEAIQNLVRREGRVARNLVSWSVPSTRSQKREDETPERDNDFADESMYSDDVKRTPTRPGYGHDCTCVLTPQHGIAQDTDAPGGPEGAILGISFRQS